MKTNKGFSLIEVLVALLLTTIGVLGMVALQGRSIQYTQDSVQRNTAIVLAGDLIEIVRAHPKELFNTSPPQFPMNSGLKDSSIFYKDAGDELADRESCVASPTRIAKQQKNCATAGRTRLKRYCQAGANYSTATCTSAVALHQVIAMARAQCLKSAWRGKFVKAPASTRTTPMFAAIQFG